MEGSTNAVTTAMVNMVTNAATEGANAIAQIVPVAGPLIVAGTVIYLGIRVWKRLRGAGN